MVCQFIFIRIGELTMDTVIRFLFDCLVIMAIIALLAWLAGFTVAIVYKVIELLK